ncbi:UrcA family protein [Sphingopyxis flava]|uniref:UrcA family protein n=1 Tax=Sphingopyxis flava TaxID=1507287 RepID=A0A1T5A306_9SPHN|nr:UrcA family protein [Sphingopyxis flava]SKB29336.1 UrcA family protein [Sphingopyxis flava]
MSKLLILAAFTTVSFAQPATARPVFQPRSAIVTHSDLDLATEKGTKALERRIWRAVVFVCGTASDYDLEGRNEVRECRRETRAIAVVEAERVVAHAARARPLQVTTRSK